MLFSFLCQFLILLCLRIWKRSFTAPNVLFLFWSEFCTDPESGIMENLDKILTSHFRWAEVMVCLVWWTIIYLLLQWWSDTTLCLIYLSGVLWGGWSEWHCVNGLMEWTLPRMVPSANSWLGSVLTAVCCKTQLSETLKAAHQHSLTHGIPLHWYELDLN